MNIKTFVILVDGFSNMLFTKGFCQRLENTSPRCLGSFRSCGSAVIADLPTVLEEGENHLVSEMGCTPDDRTLPIETVNEAVESSVRRNRNKKA